MNATIRTKNVKISDEYLLTKIVDEKDPVVFEGSFEKLVLFWDNYATNRKSMSTGKRMYINYINGQWTDSIVDSMESATDILDLSVYTGPYYIVKRVETYVNEIKVKVGNKVAVKV